MKNLFIIIIMAFVGGCTLASPMVIEAVIPAGTPPSEVCDVAGKTIERVQERLNQVSLLGDVRDVVVGMAPIAGAILGGPPGAIAGTLLSIAGNADIDTTADEQLGHRAALVRDLARSRGQC